MGQPNLYEEIMFAGDKRVIDEEAFSIEEIAGFLSVNRDQAGRVARQRCDAGEWEQVWKKAKRGNWKHVKAYRPRRKGEHE